jgi:hypothetical protein
MFVCAIALTAANFKELPRARFHRDLSGDLRRAHTFVGVF